MNIIGLVDIKEPTHDNSVVVLSGGKIVFAEAGERASRVKHDDSLPAKTFQKALEFSGLKSDDIDYVAAASPNAKFSSLILARNFGLDSLLYILATFWNSPAKTARNIFIRAGRIINKGYASHEDQIERLGIERKKIIQVCHQTSHAAAAYFASGFQGKCLAVSLDGCGPKTNGKIISGAVYICESGQMKRVEEVPPYASMGGLYGAVTEALGLKAGDGEYKTMGLASFGDPDKCYWEIKKLHPYFEKGKWHSTVYWPDFYSVMDKDVFYKTRIYNKIQKLRKICKDEDIAAALQKVFEERVLEFFHYLSEKYECKRFVCGGGIFLNIVMARKLLEQDFCESLYTYPNAGDNGISLGAAYYVYLKKTGKIPEKIDTLYLGSGFSEKDYEEAIEKYKDKINFQKTDNIAKLTAQKLVDGKVIGWFQGRAEWGPRALGDRSVLADPRMAETKDRINSKLKARDWFMPFGPSMLDSYKNDYLELIHKKEYFTDYMLFAFKVKPGMDKFPAAIHIDGTARPQILQKNNNPLYYQLISEFNSLTGVPIILNTSFNKHGLPIVHSPEDAIDHLLWGCLDGLSMGNYYIERKNVS